MKQETYNKGFTLIELLVVVLIIGILAAIALPQYMKAVEKSRATEAISLLSKLSQAEQMYKLGKGEYTWNLDELDIQATNICASNGLSYTNNFKIGVSTVGNVATGNNVFGLRATRLRDTDTYYILLRFDEGKETMWCSPNEWDAGPMDLGDSSVGALCKSIANGNPKGIIYKK